MARVSLGLAFSLVCDRGFAIFIYTHEHARFGSLIRLADGFWDEMPSESEASGIQKWRWCVFFPLGLAVHHHDVEPLSNIGIPAELREFPMLRMGYGKGKPWRCYIGGNFDGLGVGDCDDSSVPIAMIVNLARLKEMLVSDWEPADFW